MKKLFILMLVVFVAFSITALDEGIAGASKYKIQFGAGLNYNNKDGMKDYPTNAFQFEVVLPVSAIVQVGFEGKFQDNLKAAETTVGFFGSRTWFDTLNNHFKIAVGIVPDATKIKVGLYVDGGTEKMQYVITENVTNGTENLDIAGAPASTSISGNGYIEASVKIMLQSALFGSKLGKLDIKQGFKVGFLGHGYVMSGVKVVTPGGTTSDVQSGGLGGQSSYITYKYFGEIGTSIPIHTLAGWTNITKFEYGATLAYDLNGFMYTLHTLGGTATYATNPSQIEGNLSLENYLAIAPDATTEFKLTIKPGMSVSQYSHQAAAIGSVSSALVSSNHGQFFTEFGLWGKKNIDIANIMGIVPYFEMDAKWTLKWDQTAVNYSHSLYNLSAVHATFNSGNLTFDPGVKIGIKLGNWDTAIRWNPSATWGLGNNDAAQTSNIFNLANWEFTVGCEFPPPTK